MPNLTLLSAVELKNYARGDKIKVAACEDGEIQTTFDVVVHNTDENNACMLQVTFLAGQLERLEAISGFEPLANFARNLNGYYWLDPIGSEGRRIIAVRETKEPQSFKAGDFVYVPLFTTDVCRIIEDGIGGFQLRAESLKVGKVGPCFNESGKTACGHRLPSIFDATEENHKKLSDLYGVEFEKLSKTEILKEKLKQTNLILLSDDGHKPQHLEDLDSCACVIRKVREIKENRIFTANHGFYDEDDYKNVYAIRVDAEGNIVYL